MRKINVIKGDMLFQFKYGFYALYIIMIVIYMRLFSFFHGDVKNIIVNICVYSDPAAMGMFFMGALILLEKSQKVTNSIAISPVSTKEYILGKVVSIGIISELVGIVLMTQTKTENWLLTIIGIGAGSVIFSFCGIIVGTKIESLNQYIVWTIPFEMIGFVPVILYRIGLLGDNKLLLLHPGISAMELIGGDKYVVFSLVSVGIWILIMFFVVDLFVKKMFRVSAEVKL